jgi:hypothetical protein
MRVSETRFFSLGFTGSAAPSARHAVAIPPPDRVAEVANAI